MGRLHQAKRGIGDNFPYLLRVPIFGKCQKNLGTSGESATTSPTYSEYRFSENVRKILVPVHFFFEKGAGLQHAPCPAKPRGRHIVPMRLRNTPLWLYFRSVRSSEKSVKL